MRKKSLLVFLCLLLTGLVSVMGTLAYLTDTDSTVNTFTVGGVDITLDEADVDESGKPIVDDKGEPADRVKENEYHLIPGQSYTKDPTITVKAGSEEAYIRMILIVHNASAVQDIIDKYGLGDFSPMLGGWDQETWLYEGFATDAEKNTISFEFRYKEPVDPKAVLSGTVDPGTLNPGAVQTGTVDDVVLPALFDTLIVPGEVTGRELKKLYDPNEDGRYDDGFKMVVYGHAIQAAGFADEDAAWTAFDEQVKDTVAP